IGTVRYEIGDRLIPAGRTTPEAPELQAMMDQMVQAGCQSVVMEVSSHALDQKRVWGIDFDVGVFTNLTQDHLDYHETMENYFAAKARLFHGLGQAEKLATAAINIDDPWGQQLAGINGFKVDTLTFGVHPGARVRAEDCELSPDGSSFSLRSPWGDARVNLSLLGRFNISNALAAVSACGALGIDPRLMADVLAGIQSVPGRLEAIPNRRGLKVFVDYAHTDDALKNVLTTLREITPGRILLVFGCGGNRDRTKRPRMGAVAARLADYSVVTNDNPREEDPAEIARAVVEGFGEQTHYEVLLNREEAIARAVRMAQFGDVVLIAGKGHENYQEFAHTVVPFDDREVARSLLG
ncbi:MAG: UDP-N-acetylmuramoyl-L-alanyl-D-glutamate--2,6-diaminopimelate ligase, partial [Kiritimatiellae bacterium]|nr:UDP-N-acetylmuramoyl-L-alanyl-D-glutamate--2,6-diaminopimelate ligase [Kiritimatiellia bacterium]